jgi:hypothetical protein
MKDSQQQQGLIDDILLLLLLWWWLLSCSYQDPERQVEHKSDHWVEHSVTRIHPLHFFLFQKRKRKWEISKSKQPQQE